MKKSQKLPQPPTTQAARDNYLAERKKARDSINIARKLWDDAVLDDLSKAQTLDEAVALWRAAPKGLTARKEASKRIAELARSPADLGRIIQSKNWVVMTNETIQFAADKFYPGSDNAVRLLSDQLTPFWKQSYARN